MTTDGWLNGFQKVPVAINAQGTYTNTSPWKIILHTMEGWLDPSTALFRRNGYAPHFGVSLEKDRYVQYNPIDRASSALKNLRGGTETNRDNAIQVEIEGFASKSDGWPEAKVLKLVQRVLVPIIHAQPLIAPVVPFEFATSYRDANTRTRLSVAEWDATSGILGHCHVPENTHWDPGPLDIDLINTLLATELGAADMMADVGRGATGPAVKTIQRTLNAWQKSDLKVDGQFGPKTERVLQRYQRALKVPQTGRWDAATRLAHRSFMAYLEAISAIPAISKPRVVVLPPPPPPPPVVRTVEQRLSSLEDQMAILLARSEKP